MNTGTLTNNPYLESNKGDLHGENSAQAVNGAVRHIDPMREPPREHQNQDMERYKVDQEHVATPGGNLCTNTDIIRSTSQRKTPVMHPLTM